MIRTTVRHHLYLTWRGMGTLPDYGDHPGVVVCVLLIAITAVGGAMRGGLRGAMLGAAMACVVYLPMLSYGAWDRARDAERRGLI